MVAENAPCTHCGGTGALRPCEPCPHCLGAGKMILSRPDRERRVPRYTQEELDYLDEMFERRIADPRA